MAKGIFFRVLRGEIESFPIVQDERHMALVVKSGDNLGRLLFRRVGENGIASFLGEECEFRPIGCCLLGVGRKIGEDMPVCVL